MMLGSPLDWVQRIGICHFSLLNLDGSSAKDEKQMRWARAIIMAASGRRTQLMFV